MHLLFLNDEIANFEETEAILSITDLLVPVDSSAVRLASALGCSAWVMLPFKSDWRWLLERDDTHWPPDVRLFRQPNPDDRGPVPEAVAGELVCFKVRQ